MRVVETIAKLQMVSTPLVAVEVTGHIELRNKLGKKCLQRGPEECQVER